MDKWKGGVGEEDDGHDTADVISQNVFTKSVRRVREGGKARRGRGESVLMIGEEL